MKRFVVSAALAAILVPSAAVAQRSGARPAKARVRSATSPQKVRFDKGESNASPILRGKLAPAPTTPTRLPTSAEIRAEAGLVSARIGSLVSEKSSLLVRMQAAESQRSRAIKDGHHGAMTHATRHLASLKQQLETANRQIVAANHELGELSRQLNASLIFERGVAAGGK